MLEGLQKLNHNGAHGSSPLTTPVYSARSRAKGRPLMKAPNGYEVDVPGLAQAVAACVPEPTHRALISCLRAFGQLSDAKLATTRGGDDGHYLVRRKVLASNGAVVHEDHQVWIKEQLALDAGDASKTFTRLLDAKYLLSKCQLTKIYLVHDKGTDNPAAFVQVAIRQEDEFIDARAFDKYVWRTPANLADLLDAVEGDPVPTGDRSRVRPPAYMLEAVVDVDAFVAEAEAIDAQVRKLPPPANLQGDWEYCPARWRPNGRGQDSLRTVSWLGPPPTQIASAVQRLEELKCRPQRRSPV